VEAQDTDAEDDDDDEDQGPSDFIDDAAVSTSCQRVDLRVLSSRSRSAGPEEIVQGIRARAKARGLDWNEPSLHPQWGGLAPMYIISTPPSILSRLIPYLKKLHGTKRVLRSPDKRSIIYVETTNLITLTNAINKWPELNGWPDLDCRRPERPVLMSLNEQQNLIHRLRDKESAHKTVDLLAYRWVRALDMNSAYNLDLVFVLSEDEYPSSWVISKGSVTGLIVPRIDYRQPVTQSNRTPAALFDPESIKHAFPDNDPIWNEEKGIWKWSDSTFTASGLLLVTLTRDKKLVVDGVQPTDEELALFLASGEPILDRPALTQSCALHPGDLVIVNAPDTSSQHSTHNKKVGYLIDITQRSGGCFATVRSLARSNVTAGLQHFEVPVSLVKHHLLATPRNLSIGDRVCIVAGSELGTSGRIVEFIGDNEIRVLLSTSEIGVTVSVDKRHVRHNWRLGDVVEIVRGAYRGLVALIVGVLPGGGVTVYSKKNVKLLLHFLSCKAHFL
jgi:ribosomal protein L24